MNTLRYQSLPSDENEVDDPSVAELGRFSTKQINFRFDGPDKDSPLFSSDPSCEKPFRLERLVRGQVFLHNSTPKFKLQVKGFKRRQPSFFSRFLKPTVEAFDFTIPLPTPASSTFYSMPNDSPCLRGGIFSKDPSIEARAVGTHGWDRSADWDSKLASGRECDKMTKKRWNERMQNMMEAPWLPFNEGLETEVVEKEKEMDAEDPTSTLQECLTAFAQDESGKGRWLDCRAWMISGRWLIGPQTAYGWDQTLLKDELDSLRQEVNEENPTLKLSHLELKVKSPPPFFALNYGPPPQSLRARFSRLQPLLVALLPFLLHLFLLLQMTFTGKAATWLGATSLSLFVSLILIAVFGNLSSVHTSIGLAWSMNKWVKTKLPTDLPAEKVKEIFEAQGGGDGEDGRGSSHIRLTEEGWERLNGMVESEWIGKHKSKLKNAMREGKKGDLSNDEVDSASL